MKLKLTVSIVMALALVLPLIAACAKPAPVEQVKGEIVVGHLEDLSAAMAATCTGVLEGQTACIKYLNEQYGGILGHPIRSIVIDCKMDSSLAISGWNRFRDEGVPLVYSTAAVVMPFVAERAQQDMITTATGMGEMDVMFPKQPSYYFIMGPQVMGTFYQLFELMEQDWASKGKSGKPKVCIDVVTMGNQAKMYTKGTKIMLEPRGWEYLLTRTSIAAADATTQVLQAKQFNPDYMMLNNTASSTVVWLKEMDRQNFRPITFGSTNASAPEVWQACGELAVGMKLYQLNYIWTDTDIPFVKWLHDLNAKWDPSVTFKPAHYVRGFQSFLVLAEGLRRAVEKVGYENLNGTAVKEALETISSYDPGDPKLGIPKLGMTYTITPTEHQGTRGAIWYEWAKDGTLKRITEYKDFPPLTEEQKTNAWWLTD